MHIVVQSLPNIDNPAVFLAKQSFVFDDRNGGELYRFYTEQDRTRITLDNVPSYVPNAFIAIEDKRFHRRSCIDVRALTRAIVANITSYKSQGASTITQQLVRTAILSREKTMERKVRELILACQVEQKFTKNEILTQYLNWVSFGHGIAGIQQASQRYFSKDAKDVSIAQSAVLAALPQRPTYFSPYGPQRKTTVSDTIAAQIRSGNITDVSQIEETDINMGLLGTSVRIAHKRVYIPGRADVVLQAMLHQKHISSEEWQEANRELQTMSFAHLKQEIQAPHFVLSLKQEIEQWTDNAPEHQPEHGLHIQTTIDPHLQQIAQEVIERQSESMLEQYGAQNMALVAVDPKTNEILAYVGNADFYDDDHGGQIDMVRIPRQTGSTFKPFVYAALLEQGYTSESVIHDVPLDPRIYRPYKSGYYGRMTLRTALARSRNTPAIRAFFLAGGEDIILEMAERVGILTPKWYKQLQNPLFSRFRYGWPLALGAAEASLLEMVQGFSVLANDGVLQPIAAIRNITDNQGVDLITGERSKQRVLQSSTAQQLTSMLSDEKARETEWQPVMHLPFTSAAIKTGTSNICAERDFFGSCKQIKLNNTWTIGYTDDLLVGVWVGNVDNAPLDEEGTSIMSALPVWKDFMVSRYQHYQSTLASDSPSAA